MASRTHTQSESSPRTTKVYGIHVSQRAANAVLSAVTTGVNTYGAKSVTAVGHSLGAAISLLDAIFLPLHIPGLTVTYYGYGLPRVRIIVKVSRARTLENLIHLSRRSEIKTSPITSMPNLVVGSLALLTSRILFRLSPVDSWASTILLVKLTLIMEWSGSGVLARITPMLNAALEILQTSSSLTPMIIAVRTMVSTWSVKLFFIHHQTSENRFARSVRQHIFISISTPSSTMLNRPMY